MYSIWQYCLKGFFHLFSGIGLNYNFPFMYSSYLVFYREDNDFSEIIESLEWGSGIEKSPESLKIHGSIRWIWNPKSNLCNNNSNLKPSLAHSWILTQFLMLRWQMSIPCKALLPGFSCSTWGICYAVKIYETEIQENSIVMRQSGQQNKN